MLGKYTRHLPYYFGKGSRPRRGLTCHLEEGGGVATLRLHLRKEGVEARPCHLQRRVVVVVARVGPSRAAEGGVHHPCRQGEGEGLFPCLEEEEAHPCLGEEEDRPCRRQGVGEDRPCRQGVGEGPRCPCLEGGGQHGPRRGGQEEGGQHGRLREEGDHYRRRLVEAGGLSPCRMVEGVRRRRWKKRRTAWKREPLKNPQVHCHRPGEGGHCFCRRRGCRPP